MSWASGRLAEVPTYYAPDTSHDELCSNSDDRSIFRGYVDLLLTGKTDQLPLARRPAVRAAAGAEAERFVLPRCRGRRSARRRHGARLAFGGSRPRRRTAGAVRSAQLRVSIRHGDLPLRATRCWWATTPATPSSAPRRRSTAR